MLSGTDPVWLPYAVTVGGAIIQIYDSLVHKHSDQERGSADKRWGLFKRASVMAGGELNVKAMLTHKFPLNQFRRALDVALNKGRHNAIKVAFDFR